MKTSSSLVRLLVLPLVFCCISIQVTAAATVPPAVAATVARNFYWQNCANGKSLTYNAIQPVLDSIKIVNGDTLFYAFNFPGDNGFILVSGQKAVPPVLAYADQGSLYLSNMNPAVAYMLEGYTNDIKLVADQQNAATKATTDAWNELLTITGNSPVQQGKAVVGPLLTTTWAQGCYYNASCPAMVGGPCNRALVGCVAVAMGQIIKYWNLPVIGFGSHSYTHSSLGTISTSFNLDYDYANMPNSLNTTTTETDELLYHCGVSLNMDYGTGESGANPSNITGAFIDHFYYKTTASLKDRSSYSASNWINLMIAEINASRPVLYGGVKSGGGGHGWVLDGYDNNTIVTFFHMNWGWSGSSDGWFTLDNLSPGSGSYSLDNKAAIGIEPKQCNLNFYTLANHSMSFTNDVLTINCRPWNTGDAPSRSVEVGYYLSTNNYISTSDYLFDTDIIPILTPSYTSIQSISKSIYSSNEWVPPGVYYVGLFVDHLYQENNETTISDNKYYFPNTITVNCFPPTGVSATDGYHTNRVAISWNLAPNATHYKVYRNTTNSSSGATAITGWLTTSSFNDYNAQPGIIYYYWVKAATSSTGSYAGNYSSSNSGYIDIPYLDNNLSQSVSANPSYYRFLNADPKWHTVGIRSVNASDDWDLYLYSNNTMTSQLTSSSFGGVSIDYIVIDGNHTPVATKYIKASRYSGSGGAQIEYEGGSEVLTVGSTSNEYWPAGDVIKVWDIYLPTGTYVFDLTTTSGSANLDFALFKSNGTTYHAGRNAAVASSGSSGNGGNEQFTYTATSADYYGLVVSENSTYSGYFDLKVSAAGQWLGSVSHDWHTAANWVGGIIPDATTDVVIAPGYTYYPKLMSGNGNCKSLRVESAAQLDLEAYDLNVSEYARIFGDLNLTHSNADLNVDSYFYFESGSTASMVANAQLRVEGTFWFKSGANVQLDAGELIMTGSSPSSIYGDDADCYLHRVTFSKLNSTVTNYSFDSLFIKEHIFISNGCTLAIHSASDPFVLSGYIYNSGGALMLDYGDFIMTGSSFTTTLLSTDYFNNLIIGQAGPVVNTTKFFNSEVHIKGDLIIRNHSLRTISQNIFVEGNWANYRGDDGFIEGSSQVHFVGANASDILTDETFYDLILDKTYTGFDGLEVTGTLNISNNLNIVDGTLELNQPCEMNIGKSVIIANGAGFNANDAGSILINVGNDWADQNLSNSNTTGFSSGSYSVVRFNGDGSAKAWQSINTANPFNRLVVATTSSSVYPTGPDLQCNDLIVESGTFEPFHRNIYVADSTIIHGNLLMVNADDSLFSPRIQWHSGSGGTISDGAFVVDLKWEFLNGTNAIFGANNTTYIRGLSNQGFTIVNHDNNASFGNLVLDKPGPMTMFTYLASLDTVRVLGDFTINAQNKLRTYGSRMKVGGNLIMDATSRIEYVWLGGGIEVDGDLVQTGEVILDAGYILVHGIYDLANTGVMRQSGGSFVCDKPYYSAKAWQYLSGKMVMSGGVFEITNNSIQIANSFIDSISGGEIRAGYSFEALSPGTFQPSGGTLIISGSDGPVAGPFINLHSDNFFHNLIIDCNGNDPHRVLVSNVSVQNDFTILSGRLQTLAQQLNIGRNWDNQTGATGFDPGTGKVRFFGIQASDILNPETFYMLEIDKTYGNFDGVEITAGDSITVLNNLSLTNGTLELNDAAILSVSGDVSIASGAGLNANDGNNKIYVGGNWDNLNTSYSIYAGFHPGTDSKVTFRFDGPRTLSSNTEPEEFANLFFTGDTIPWVGGFEILCPTLITSDLSLNKSRISSQEPVKLLGNLYMERLCDLYLLDTFEFTGPYNQNYVANLSFPNLRATPLIINKPGNIAKYSGSQPKDPGSTSPHPLPKAIGDTLFIRSDFAALTPLSYTQIIDGVLSIDSFDLNNWNELFIENGGEVLVGPGGSFASQINLTQVNQGGKISFLGNPALPATARLYNDAHIKIENGGSIAAEYANFSVCCDSGIVIKPGSTIDPLFPFRTCSFSPDDYLGPGTPASALLTIDNSQTLIVPNAHFQSNPLFLTPVSNVRKTVNTGNVYFKNSSGDLSGEALDDDTYNRIHWVDSLLIDMSPDDYVCLGDSIMISGSVSGGMPPYNFSWSPSASIIVPQPSVAICFPSTTTTYTLLVTDQLGDSQSGSVTITVHPLPSVSVSESESVVCEGESSTLTALGAVSYMWSHGLGSGTSHSVSPLTTTTYSVTGTDLNGCTASDEITITVHPLPSVSVSESESEVCEGENSTLTALGAVSYQWSHGLGTGASKTISPNATTTYSVTGTDANGCTAEASVTITVHPLPSVSVSESESELCEGESSTLTALGAVSYMWSHGLGTGASKTVSPATTTTYSVTGTDANGCTAEGSVTITVHPLPSVSVSESESELCEGESSTLTALGAVSYMWSHGLGTGASKTVSPATTTTYSVTGTDGNGCTAEASITITVHPLPSVSVSESESEVCEGESSTLTALGAVSYVWSHGLGTGASKTVSPVATTTYSVTGTDGNGCTAEASVTITVHPLPSVSVSESESEVCEGENSILTASGAVSYVWSHGLGTGASKTVSPVATTTYSVTGTDANGCTAEASVTVTVHPLPSVSVSESESEVCEGESSTLTALGAVSYVWSHGLGTGASKTVSPATTTTYSVTGTDGNGCTAEAMLSITVHPLPIVSASATPDTLIPGYAATLNASGASTYSWDQGLGNGATHTVYPLITTTYEVVGTNAEGCSAQTSVTVHITLPGASLSGDVTYHNALTSPMPSTYLDFALPPGPLVYMDTTDASGHYHLDYVIAGKYQPGAATTLPWGGANAVDALLIMRHFVEIDTLTGLPLIASDLNLDGNTNASDALMVALRFVDSLSSFPAGDYYFDLDSLETDGHIDQVYDFQAICYGDVNSSYIPGLKQEEIIPMIRQDVLLVGSTEVLLPLYFSDPLQLGALSLHLPALPEGIVLKEIIFNTSQGTAVSRRIENGCRAAWFSLEGWETAKDQAFAYLRLDVSGYISAGNSLDFQLPDLFLEIAGTDGKKEKVAFIHYPELLKQAREGIAFRTWPNPFSEGMTLWAGCAEESQLQLILRDIQGKEIKQMADIPLRAGSNEIFLDLKALPAGIYFIHLEWSGSREQGQKAIRIIKY